ncbi:MAG: AI-2E family transporter, partial [Thermoanaerobaculia bacterium]
MVLDRGTKILLVTAALVVVVAGLRAAAPILQPLLLALFLAVVSFPLLDWLRRRGVRTGLAVLVTVIADVALVSILGLLVTGAVNEFASTAPAYLEQLFDRAKATLTLLEERGIRLSDWVAMEPIEPRHFVDVAGGILGGTVKGVASAVYAVTLVTVARIFILYELVIFPGKLRAALSSPGDSTRHFKSA